MIRSIAVFVAVLSLAGCQRDFESGEIRTHYHEGLCFVTYDNYSTGTAMVEVDCSKLKPEVKPEVEATDGHSHAH
jgi:hypothetical protein